MSTEFLLKFREKETLKRVRICEKILKRKLERKVVAKLVAGKILRSTETQYYLLRKHNITHVEKHSCEQLLCTYNHSAINVIKVSK